MKSGMLWLLYVLFLSTSLVAQHIHTDQAGYLPEMMKIAVLANPQTGYNSGESYTPGNTLELRNAQTHQAVWSGSPLIWANGQTHSQSGDKIWWLDFSGYQTPGTYYLYDPSVQDSSFVFEISPCVYKNVADAALKAFYFQRCGSTKNTIHAGSGYADATCHTGASQDTDCRLYSNPVPATSRNLSGGWHDAGDYNKYVNFAWGAVLDLLMGYLHNPLVFGDDLNIPESNNGKADILDEVTYELNWLLNMQEPDGSVLSVVGGGGASPPSADIQPRYYGPATEASSYSAAGMFAAGAYVFRTTGDTAYAYLLQQAAENAYAWAVSHPGVVFYNAGTLAAGEQQTDGYGTLTRKFSAEVFLYALTLQNSYKTAIENYYNQFHLLQWGYAYPFESKEQDLLLFYSDLPGVTPTVATAIQTTYTQSVQLNNSDNLPAFQNGTDAYRAYLSDQNYTWNSNQTKSNQANLFLDMLYFGLDAPNHANYREAAAGFLHYMHGVNPNGKFYMTNMQSVGIENSVAEVYHAWFHHGSLLWDSVGLSSYGPAPGFIPGGANPAYDWDGCCPGGCGSTQNNALCFSISIDPPKNQPVQKSYKDFNNSWPINSWEITEPGIYTQAAYVRMASWFLDAQCLNTLQEQPVLQPVLANLYPNPAQRYLQLEVAASLSGKSWEVRDIQGRILHTGIISSPLFSIPVENLSNGLYIWQVPGICSRKFVKN